VWTRLPTSGLTGSGGVRVGTEIALILSTPRDGWRRGGDFGRSTTRCWERDRLAACRYGAGLAPDIRNPLAIKGAAQFLEPSGSPGEGDPGCDRAEVNRLNGVPRSLYYFADAEAELRSGHRPERGCDADRKLSHTTHLAVRGIEASWSWRTRLAKSNGYACGALGRCGANRCVQCRGWQSIGQCRPGRPAITRTV